MQQTHTHTHAEQKGRSSSLTVAPVSNTKLRAVESNNRIIPGQTSLAQVHTWIYVCTIDVAPQSINQRVHVVFPKRNSSRSPCSARARLHNQCSCYFGHPRASDREKQKLRKRKDFFESPEGRGVGRVGPVVVHKWYVGTTPGTCGRRRGSRGRKSKKTMQCTEYGVVARQVSPDRRVIISLLLLLLSYSWVSSRAYYWNAPEGPVSRLVGWLLGHFLGCDWDRKKKRKENQSLCI